jgi:hypothetical protein
LEHAARRSQRVKPDSSEFKAGGGDGLPQRHEIRAGRADEVA